MDDPIQMIIEQHRMAEQLMERIEQAEGDARGPMVEQLSQMLELHMTLEEQLLYPLVQRHVGEEEAEEAETEHEVARKAMQAMLDLAPDEPGFDGALAALKGGILHHVEEEEKEILPKLRSALPAEEQEVLATEMATMMDDAEEAMAEGRTVRGGGRGDLADMSKAELMEQAREADIPGRSSMTKQQLVKALSDRS